MLRKGGACTVLQVRRQLEAGKICALRYMQTTNAWTSKYLRCLLTVNRAHRGVAESAKSEQTFMESSINEHSQENFLLFNLGGGYERFSSWA